MTLSESFYIDVNIASSNIDVDTNYIQECRMTPHDSSLYVIICILLVLLVCYHVTQAVSLYTGLDINSFSVHDEIYSF